MPFPHLLLLFIMLALAIFAQVYSAHGSTERIIQERQMSFGNGEEQGEEYLKGLLDGESLKNACSLKQVLNNGTTNSSRS